jgi:hypothetical protein
MHDAISATAVCDVQAMPFRFMARTLNDVAPDVPFPITAVAPAVIPAMKAFPFSRPVSPMPPPS